VRDIAGWFSSTFHAKAQRDKLQKEVNTLVAENAQLKQQVIGYNQLRAQVGLDTSNSISAYKRVTAHVISRDPNLWWATIQVDKGSDDGVKVDAPVTGDGALIGKVSLVAPTVSVVTLITDPSFAVSAEVQDQYGDTGVLVPKVGDPNSLLLQYLPPHAPISVTNPPTRVVTSGFSTPSGSLKSLYPAGIPIGWVSGASQTGLINNRQVQVTPFADLRHLDFVQILTNVDAGTQRAQVP
jgi:rod shape-determining protein MreC